MASRPVGGWRLASLLAAIIILTDMFIYRIPGEFAIFCGHTISPVVMRALYQLRGKCGAWLSIQAFAKWLYCHSFVTTRAKWPRKKHFPDGSRDEPSGASIGRTSVTV